MALLCLGTLVAGFVTVRNPGDRAATALRVDSAADAGSFVAQAPVLPADTGPPPPVAAISLTELAIEVRARTSTSTTRPRTTTTTTRKAVTTTSPVPTSTTKPAALPATTTTTTAPPSPLPSLVARIAPPAGAATGALTKSDSGVASWFHAPDRTCAHRSLPFGTMVKVTRTPNGASTTCKVSDRGPTVETGRLIDLSLDTFEKLAAKEAGLVDVRIEW